MNISDYAKTILMGESLADKLLDPAIVDDFVLRDVLPLPKYPGRESRYAPSDERMKFPKRDAFRDPKKVAQALHAFANHELLAIEMMAAFILCVPHDGPDDLRAKRSVLATIRDEQKHFKMYLQRLRELGSEFGDWPLNDFFWDQMRAIKTPAHYFAIMAFTFEAANLDFSEYYASLFRELGDLKTAEVLEEVHRDEISHVALGAHWLQNWKGDRALWDYYNDLLPEKLTPARAKGLHVSRKARLSANLPEDFVQALEEYRDDYRSTNRRTWNKSTGL